MEQFLAREVEKMAVKWKNSFCLVEVEVTEMKKAVLTGSYSFSVLKIVILEEKYDWDISNFSKVMGRPEF